MHSRLWHALAATAALLASTVATAVAAPQTPAGDTGDHVPIAGSTGASPSRTFSDAEATTAALESAFGTRIAAFRARIDGITRTLTAPASPVTVPISLRASITAVLGLDDSAALLKPQHTRPAAVAA